MDRNVEYSRWLAVQHKAPHGLRFIASVIQGIASYLNCLLPNALGKMQGASFVKIMWNWIRKWLIRWLCKSYLRLRVISGELHHVIVICRLSQVSCKINRVLRLSVMSRKLERMTNFPRIANSVKTMFDASGALRIRSIEMLMSSNWQAQLSALPANLQDAHTKR